MKSKAPVRIKTISEFHKLRNLPKPEHPLISVIDYAQIEHHPGKDPDSWTMDFYSISMKRTTHSKIRYGQQEYDFDEGIMFFMAPGQVLRLEAERETLLKGWSKAVHAAKAWTEA